MAYSIPDVAGVPALNFAPGSDQGIELVGADTTNYFTSLFAPQWGIFQGGSAVVTADSVISMDYRQEWSIADYTVEEGGFESYNKVALPFDARVRFASGGSEANRQALLDSIAAIAGTTNLFDVVTPEETYPSVNISHYDYRRTATNGVGLIQVDVWCLQINVSGSSGGLLSNTQMPGAASQTNNGTIQAEQPSASLAGTSVPYT